MSRNGPERDAITLTPEDFEVQGDQVIIRSERVAAAARAALEQQISKDEGGPVDVIVYAGDQP